MLEHCLCVDTSVRINAEELWDQVEALVADLNPLVRGSASAGKPTKKGASNHIDLSAADRSGEAMLHQHSIPSVQTAGTLPSGIDTDFIDRPPLFD